LLLLLLLLLQGHAAWPRSCFILRLIFSVACLLVFLICLPQPVLNKQQVLLPLILRTLASISLSLLGRRASTRVMISTSSDSTHSTSCSACNEGK
jgi:hypothetical protein